MIDVVARVVNADRSAAQGPWPPDPDNAACGFVAGNAGLVRA
jgi:hypothetical protein